MKRNLVNFRKRLGITQKDISKQIGYSPQYICRIENSSSDGSIDFWKKFSEAYLIEETSDLWELMKDDK